MKILHYALGFPPYRTGGLTKFCMDLMVQQKKEGHQVALLWPGKMSLIGSASVSIKDRGDVDVDGCGIQSFEVINPLPISYDEGITEIPAFTLDAGSTVYKDLLRTYKPDVIHIHTLMGLHSSFLDVAKEINIRTVFSAHDFFPICPKVTMYRHGAICSLASTCEECPQCNTTALSLDKIKLLQSSTYRTLKNSSLVKAMRKHHRDEYLSESSEDPNATTERTASDYKSLRSHYQSMLRKTDVIHYNSTVTESVYKSSFSNLPPERVISITHSDIRDHRKKKSFPDNFLRIRYLGPQGGAKGFFLLKAALDKLWEERKFTLDIHFTPTEMSPYMNVHDRYTYDDLEQLFDETDILVAPSQWYETFGYTVLEALSFGVPVVISGTVGAKDVLAEGAGVVLENIDSEKLYRFFKGLDAEKLRDMNEAIVDRQEIMTIGQMVNEIEEQCY